MKRVSIILEEIRLVKEDLAKLNTLADSKARAGLVLKLRNLEEELNSRLQQKLNNNF